MLRLPGYSEEEKLEIARRYLTPRQLKETGLTAEQCRIDDDVVKRIITGYTREAGLRQLERGIGRVARKVALRFAEGTNDPVTVEPDQLADLLGPERFHPEQLRKELPPGVATGLAWTETGGDVLYIEATLLPDGKGLTLTGQLGEVMQESAKAAQSYVWAHADEFGIDRASFKDYGVHVHVPAGAIPKDGPSAGITMATALTSLYTKLPVRSDTAMTGEITLTGMVLPIGGLKEKVLAARRAGLKRVILPKPNQTDLRELPEEVRADVEFVFVERIEEVLAAAIPSPAGPRPTSGCCSRPRGQALSRKASLVLSDRFLDPALSRQRVSQVVVSLCPVGLESHGLRQVLCGLIEFSLPTESHSQVVVRLCPVGPELQGLDEVRYGSSSSLPCCTKAVPRLDWATAELGLGGGPLREVRDGFAGSSLVQENGAQVVVRDEVVFGQLQGVIPRE